MTANFNSPPTRLYNCFKTIRPLSSDWEVYFAQTTIQYMPCIYSTKYIFIFTTRHPQLHITQIYSAQLFLCCAVVVPVPPPPHIHTHACFVCVWKVNKMRTLRTTHSHDTPYMFAYMIYSCRRQIEMSSQHYTTTPNRYGGKAFLIIWLAPFQRMSHRDVSLFAALVRRNACTALASYTFFVSHNTSHRVVYPSEMYVSDIKVFSYRYVIHICICWITLCQCRNEMCASDNTLFLHIHAYIKHYRALFAVALF